MAIKKPVTTADLSKEAEPAPVDPGSVRVTSPAGFVTVVPESIVEALLDSGYSKSK